MRKKILGLTCFLVVLASFFLIAFAGLPATFPFRALTYNIRYADDRPVSDWQARKAAVVSQIVKQSSDVFGLQEAMIGQINDIANAMPSYAWIGLGRDDGKEKGEFSPLFYRTDRFQAVDYGTFWLSATPSLAGSRGWDAACNRVATWAKLKRVIDGKQILVMCTHFDHMGDTARLESAKLVLRVIDSLGNNMPTLLLGDFNCEPGSAPYQVLVKQLKDSRLLARQVSGPMHTYTGFEVGAIPGEQIDHLFVRNVKMIASFHVDDYHQANYYPSDHLPVTMEMTW